jgi:sec-independent protein translocase protein TatB
MEFLGIGIPELLVIAVLALIFVGPDRLPEAMVKIARFVQDFREFSGNVTRQFNEAVQEMQEEFKDVTDVANEGFRNVNEQIAAAERSASAPLEQTPPAAAPITTGEEEPAEPAGEPAETPAAAQPAGVSATGVASLEEIRRRVLRSSNGAGASGALTGLAGDRDGTDSTSPDDRPQA